MKITTLLPASEHAKFEEMAWQHRMTLSQFTRWLLTISLQHLDSAKAERIA